MPVRWRATAIVPAVLGVAGTILTQRTVWVGIGAVWFLSVVAVATGFATFFSVQKKWHRSKRGALAAFLQGGYTLSAASMAAYIVFFLWTSYRPDWLMHFVFAGILLCFSSGIVNWEPKRALPQKNIRSRESLRVMKNNLQRLF